MVNGVRRTKIMATLGPASDREAVIHELIAAGVDLFRLNFSHGTHESHAAALARIRAAAEHQGRAVAVLQDLAGPKIRTGMLAGGAAIDLHDGDKLQVVFGDVIGGPGLAASRPPSLDWPPRCTPATTCCSTTARSNCG